MNAINPINAIDARNAMGDPRVLTFSDRPDKRDKWQVVLEPTSPSALPEDGIKQGERPDLMENRADNGESEKDSDARILGNSGFIEKVLRDAN